MVRDGKIERGVSKALEVIDAISLDWSRSDIELMRRIYQAKLLPSNSFHERDLRTDEINQIAESNQSDLVRCVARFAQQTMADTSKDFTEFFTRALAEFVITNSFPRTVIVAAVKEYDRNVPEIIGDMAAFKRSLGEGPELFARAQEILNGSDSERVVKKFRPRRDIESLLGTPLQELAS